VIVRTPRFSLWIFKPHPEQIIAIRTVFAGEIGAPEAVARADGTIAVSSNSRGELHVSSLSSTIITVFGI